MFAQRDLGSAILSWSGQLRSPVVMGRIKTSQADAALSCEQADECSKASGASLQAPALESEIEAITRFRTKKRPDL
jgi:hypothetical protein